MLFTVFTMVPKRKMLAGGAVLICAVCYASNPDVAFKDYTVREEVAVRDLKAFANWDFEDRSTHGKKNDHEEIGESFGYNGSSGLRISPLGKKYTYVFPCTAKLEYGKKYVFTLYMRKHGKVFSHVAWEAYGKKGSVGSNWNVRKTAMEGGWEKVEVDAMLRENETPRVSKFFVILTPQGKTPEEDASPENYYDYDLVSLREDVPEWLCFNTWPTHNRVYSDSARVRFYSCFVGAYLPAEADAVHYVELFAADARRLAAQALKDEKGVFTADFGRLPYKGPAKLRVSLMDRKNRVNAGTREFDVEVMPTPAPKKDVVFVKENGQAILNGKPYMPLGFFSAFGKNRNYSYERTAEHMKRLREAGFNILMEYWPAQWDREQEKYYTLCYTNGIKLLYNFNQIIHRRDEIPLFAARAKKMTSEIPAIIGWYTFDELTTDMVPFLEKFRRALNEATPDELTWYVNIHEPEPFLGTGDVQGGDNYPIDTGNRDLEAMDRYMRRCAACRPALAWHCPQCMNWANYRKGAKESREKYLAAGREPEENEMLSVALLYASWGVTGFIFYHYEDMFSGPVPELYEKRWNDMKGVGAALKSLEPFITSAQPIREIPHEDVKGKTRVVALSDGKGAYRVLVIGLSRENECAFRLPVAYGPLASRCGNTVFADGSYRFAGKEFSCDILECSYARVKSSRDGAETRTGFYFPSTEAPVPLLVGLHSWSTDASYPTPGILLGDWCRRNGWAFLYPDFRGPNCRPEACGSELAVQDVLDAVAWAKKMHRIDADRVYAAGGSGGGHMALLAAAKAPDVFAAVAAFCPITDLARWHADGLKLKNEYPAMLESSCGGTPKKFPDEYARRSPLPLLGGVTGPKFYIAAGIHDGHGKNSVPVGHSVRAFNALATDADRLSEADIAHIEKTETAPERLSFIGDDPFYAPEKRIHLRVTSKDVRLTLFEGGHQDNYPAALDFLARQKRGTTADWTLPTRAAESVKGNGLYLRGGELSHEVAR